MAKQPESNQPRPVSAPIDSAATDPLPQRIVVRVPELEPAARQSGRAPQPNEIETVIDAKSRLDTIAPRQPRQPHRDSVRSSLTEVPQIEERSAEQDEVTVAERIHRNRKPLSSVLLSTIVHTTLLVILALVVFATPGDNAAISIIAEIDATPAPEEVAVDIETVEIIAEDSAESPIDFNAEDLATDVDELAPQEQNSLIQLPSELVNPSQATDPQPVAPNQLLPSGGGLEGRDAESRARLAARRGGSRAAKKLSNAACSGSSTINTKTAAGV